MTHMVLVAVRSTEPQHAQLTTQKNINVLIATSIVTPPEITAALCSRHTMRDSNRRTQKLICVSSHVAGIPNHGKQFQQHLTTIKCPFHSHLCLASIHQQMFQLHAQTTSIQETVNKGECTTSLDPMKNSQCDRPQTWNPANRITHSTDSSHTRQLSLTELNFTQNSNRIPPHTLPLFDE